MKNIKLTYIPVKKSDIFEGLSFYDSLSESFTYTTDSNKWFFKDINIDNMESKIKDIMYNSLIKILFDKDKLPEPYIGTAASEENAKIDICNRFFKAYWNLVIWGGTQTGASVLKYIKRDIINGGIPKTCKNSNINKGKINNIYVYEFEYINVDKEREAFNLKKLNNPEYLEKILRDIVNIELYFRKDDLITQMQ